MKRSYLGDWQEWGQDEVRIYTLRGWIICRKGKEMQEELANLRSSLIQQNARPRTF